MDERYGYNRWTWLLVSCNYVKTVHIYIYIYIYILYTRTCVCVFDLICWFSLINLCDKDLGLSRMKDILRTHGTWTMALPWMAGVCWCWVVPQTSKNWGQCMSVMSRFSIVYLPVPLVLPTLIASDISLPLFSHQQVCHGDPNTVSSGPKDQQPL